MLTLLAVTLITLDARGVSIFTSTKESTMDVASPVQRFGQWVSSPFRSVWNGITDYPDLAAENEALRLRVEELEGQNLRDENLAEELRRIQEQLDIEYITEYDSQIARVVSGPYSNFANHTIELDQGSNAGIRVGNPVITQRGLVGRVETVSAQRSVVQLITDSAFSVGIKIASNQDQGVGRGGGSSEFFIVDAGIALGDPIEIDDVVVTGGVSNRIMPPGDSIPVGTVSRIVPDEVERLQILYVDYAVDFGQLDVVQVLDWVPTP